MQLNQSRSAWLKGPAFSCETDTPSTQRSWRLVLLGAPGAGKGTLGDMLAQRNGICPLSTGDVFRAAKALSPEQRSPAITAALEYMKRGDLVPDSTVVDLVRERLVCLQCPGGFALDGFPRTVGQAEALQTMLAEHDLHLDAVFSCEMTTEAIIKRIEGRRICSKCKAVFHVVTRRPKAEGICDFCGSALELREDDRPEAMRVRLEIYERSTKPLIEYYRQLGLLVSIDSGISAERTYELAMAALAER